MFYLYDYIDRMTKAGNTVVQWDYWGSMTDVWSHTFYYDDSDRLTRYDGSGTSNDVTYTYAAGSWERFKQNLNGALQYFLWDEDNLIAEYASAGTVSQTFLHAVSAAHLSTDVDESTYYYFHDARGSVRNLVGSDQIVRNVYDYRYFGADCGTQTASVANSFRYKGYYANLYGQRMYTIEENLYAPIPAINLGRNDRFGGPFSEAQRKIQAGKTYGEAWCDEDSGEMKSKVYRDYPFNCQCITAHENKHKEQIRECCRRTKKCREVEGQSRSKCRREYNKWFDNNEPLWDHEAAEVEYKCGKKCWDDNCVITRECKTEKEKEELRRENLRLRGTPDCAELDWWGRGLAKRDFNYRRKSAGKKIKDCPFDENGKIRD